MTVTPLHDRIVVSRLEDSEPSPGAIVIPDSAKEKPQHGQAVALDGIEYLIMKEEDVLDGVKSKSPALTEPRISMSYGA